MAFTDGSHYPNQEFCTGSLIYRMYQPGEEIEEDRNLKVKKAVFKNLSNIHEAEEMMILNALRIFKNSFSFVDNIIIYSDSVKALREIKSNSEYNKLKEYYTKQGVNIDLRKVKAKNDNALNVYCDVVAKSIGRFLMQYNSYINDKKKLGVLYN